MYWLKRIVVCGLAILFAASGVRKATGRDAGSWQVVHGVARVAFGSSVVVGTLWSAFRRREIQSKPSDSESSTPTQTGE